MRGERVRGRARGRSQRGHRRERDCEGYPRRRRDEATPNREPSNVGREHAVEQKSNIQIWEKLNH